MYDYSKLIGRIAEKFGTRGKFAARLGKSESLISMKLDNKAVFKQPEITAWCEALEIELNEIPDYFFTLKVQYA